MATKKIRIILAEDCEIFGIGFRQIIQKQAKKEISLLCIASDTVELLENVKKYKPNVVVSITNLKGQNNIQLCKMIRKKYPKTNLLLLIDTNNEKLILEILEAGANGFILKNATTKELIEAIKTVAEGSSYYCSSMPNKFWEGFSNNQRKKNKNQAVIFSSKELIIIKFICEGYTTIKIAKALKLSPRTIEDYRHKIIEKMGVKNVAELVFYATTNSLI